MEIEYGSLSNPKQLERTLFYFRAFEGEVPASYRSEDSLHTAKLAGNRLRTYPLGWDQTANQPVGLERFAALVESDVRLLRGAPQVFGAVPGAVTTALLTDPQPAASDHGVRGAAAAGRGGTRVREFIPLSF